MRFTPLLLSALLLSTPIAAAAPADSLDPVRQGSLLLRRGSRGPAVRELQEALSRAGCALVIDGAFGANTEQAVLQFQQGSGLAVDGLVGRHTLAAIEGAPAGSPLPLPPPRPAGRALGRIPGRSSAALTGSEFMAHTRGLSRVQREDRILAELELGNLPGFLRTFQPVSFQAVGGDGLTHSVQLWVMPDYLAIGDERDFVRIPMGSLTAQRLADLYGCILPTRKMVDAIYRAASVKLSPIPMTPSAAMMSNDYFAQHQALVERQWSARLNAARGELTGGHKKDVVISNRLATRPGQVAIYGWHRLNGQPIQPLSTVHENSYADYSHGVRMVHETAFVDGIALDVASVLRDPALWPLLSDEGLVASPRVPGVPGVSAALPAAPRPGWVGLRRLRDSEVTPAISAEAVRILREHRNDPYGTEVPFVADGNTYVARIEQHYHAPGGAQKPWGYHPGVSVLEPIYP